MTTRAELRALLAKATPGEWFVELREENEPGSPDIYAIHAGDDSYEATLCEAWSGEHDNKVNLELIVALHNSAPALLDRIDALEKALRGLYEQCDSLEDFKFTRDLPLHEAQDNWNDARYAASKALEGK